MCDSETKTQLPTLSDVDIDFNGILPSQTIIRFPPSQSDCVETSQMAPSLSDQPTDCTKNEQPSSTPITSVKIPLLIRHHSLDSGSDERFPTYLIPDRRPTAIKKFSLPMSYETQNRLAQVANIQRSFGLSPINSQKSSLRCRKGSLSRPAVDWGPASEWIMRYDNLLESKSSPPCYNRQLSGEYHGKNFKTILVINVL